MWGIFEFFYFIPATVIYLGIAFLGLSYFYMGIVQLASGEKDGGPDRQPGALVSLIISIAILGLASYAYFEYIWLW